MPKTSTPPKHRLHKATGLGRVCIAGRDYYTARYNTPEADEVYRRLIGQWAAGTMGSNGSAVVAKARADQAAVNRSGDPVGALKAEQAAQQAGAELPPTKTITVAEVCLAYLKFAIVEYDRGGKPSEEYNHIRRVVKSLRMMFGSLRAAEFGSARLLEFRDALCRAEDGDAKPTRTHVNTSIGRVKRMFKWAAERELVPSGTAGALLMVKGLSRTSGMARPNRKVKPIAAAWVDATCEYLHPVMRDIVKLLECTGMRCGELCQMTTGSIDMSDPDVWEYRPARHKTESHDVERVIYLGERAQGIVRRYLLPKLDAVIFTPARALEAINAEKRAKRKSKVPPSQVDRRKTTGRKRNWRASYDATAIRHAILAAVERANAERVPNGLAPIPAWHPHQLRHSFATLARRKHGIEAAQALLSHTDSRMTQRYAELDSSVAREAVRKIG